MCLRLWYLLARVQRRTSVRRQLTRPGGVDLMVPCWTRLPEGETSLSKGEWSCILSRNVLSTKDSVHRFVGHLKW